MNSYFKTLKQELSDTKTYEETSEDEKFVVVRHCNDVALKFSVIVNEQQSFLRCTVYLNIINDCIKQGLLLILAPVPLLNFRSY